jgi:ribosomal protein S18 acetylase RimI-like enzyme
MEIKKELFLDCISGKIEGYFILRDGQRIHSSYLSFVNYNVIKTDPDTDFRFLLSNIKEPYGFLHMTYNEYGLSNNGINVGNDIVDFEITGRSIDSCKITKIKTNWDESPNSRTIIYFTYENVGVCRLNINEGDNFGTIVGLYVDENNRNNGIGKELIKYCEDELQNYNVKYMKLYVDKNTKDTEFLLGFYQKQGYEIFETAYLDQYGLLKKIK